MGSYQEHQNLIKRFKFLAQKEIKGIRVFDRHVGLLYTKKGRSVKINRKGMADCYALFPAEIGLIHIEIEAKTGNSRQTKEQKQWQKFIENNNGLYILMRNEFEAVKEIKEYLKRGGFYEG